MKFYSLTEHWLAPKILMVHLWHTAQGSFLQLLGLLVPFLFPGKTAWVSSSRMLMNATKCRGQENSPTSNKYIWKDLEFISFSQWCDDSPLMSQILITRAVIPMNIWKRSFQSGFHPTASSEGMSVSITTFCEGCEEEGDLQQLRSRRGRTVYVVCNNAVPTLIPQPAALSSLNLSS